MPNSDEEYQKLRGAGLVGGLNNPQTQAGSGARQFREPSQQVTFIYRNWKGEIRERRVVPLNIEFTHDNYHVPDQWLMHAIDMDKGARRTFAFEHILSPIRRV